jgi:VWFA-related protein
VAFTLLVSGLTGVGGGGRSGTDAPIPHSSRTETVSSELVLIETYVTDGSGRPVKGLTKDDFILEVGGLRRPIASVEFREFGAPPEGAAQGSGSSSVPPALQAVTWPRRFVLFFDDNTSRPFGMTEVRKAARLFLASGLLPSDQVALASYDERLRLLQDFTTDREALMKALTTSLQDSTRFSSFQQEREQHIQEIGSKNSPRFVQTLCEMEKNRWVSSVNATESLIASLAGWRGYKAIVFMGDGIPESPMEPYWKALALQTQRHPRAAPPAFEMMCTLSDEIKELGRLASASGVTLDTIQARGLSAGTRDEENLASKESNALRTLALNTAGVYSRTNDFLETFHQIEAASRVFYILAYVPEEPADGRYRHVVVRCRRPGVQLRFRRGFTRLPPEEARSRAVEAAYQFPSMFPGLDAGLATAEGPGAGDERVVDLIVHVPLAKILFLPQAGGTTARLSVGFVSIDDARRKTFETSRSVRIGRPDSVASVAGIDLYCRARLPRVGQTVTAVVSDEQSGVVGGAKIRFEGASPPDGRLLGLSLYSPSTRSLWIEVPSSAASKDAVLVASDAEAGPTLKSAFDPGEPIVAGFRLAPGDTTAPLEFHLEIRRGAEVVRARTVAIAPEGLAGAVKVPVPAEGLASGEYVLSLHAVHGAVEIAVGTTPFLISDAEIGSSP